MGIPLRYVAKIGGYILKQHLTGRKRYPLVMMMEPLFRCNLACAGCGKIDYPDEILNKRLPVADALESVRECGAPVVVIAPVFWTTVSPVAAVTKMPCALSPLDWMIAPLSMLVRPVPSVRV